MRVTLDELAASGHALAIYGYADDGTVLIADPMHANDKISVSFTAFAAGGQIGLGGLHGTWQGAYLTKGQNE